MGLRPPMDKTEARKILLRIKEIFDNSKTKFWLSGGTCLGAVREGHFISYDDDIDINMLARDFSPGLDKALSKIAPLQVFRHPENGKPFGLHLIKNEILVCILFRYYLPKKDIYFVNDRKPRLPITFMLGKSLRDDYWVNFLDTKFRVPNPPEEYLENMYGKNWRTPFDPHKTGFFWKKNYTKIPPKKFAKYLRYVGEGVAK